MTTTKKPTTKNVSATSGRILVVDDELSMREFLSIALSRVGHEVVTAESGEQALEVLSLETFDLVITDLRMEKTSGLDVLAKVSVSAPQTEVIVVTAFATPETAIEAMKAGAYDYLQKPFKVDEILLVCHRALERHNLAQENVTLRKKLESQHKLDAIIGKSCAMQRVFDLIVKVAAAKTNVLISGESGTGKELVAQAIHNESPRNDRPFRAINCGAIPTNLLESELFGHTKGAFTGADRERPGLFREADGGSVLLDEISEMDPLLQVKLLRVLQERKVRPVGADTEEQVDVRVLAATNKNLNELVSDGSFREDLFYRLNVIQIQVPPLRQRREDIPLLVDHFVQRFASETEKTVKGVSRDALEMLMSHPFGGNVRQLENMVERAVTLSSEEVLEAKDFTNLRTNAVTEGLTLNTLLENGVSLDEALADIERRLIEQALDRADGVRTKAAKLLGISFRSLRYRLDKMDFDENN